MSRLFKESSQNKENHQFVELPRFNAPDEPLEHTLDAESAEERPSIGPDRFIASRAHTLQSNTVYQEVLSARLDGSFDAEPSTYRNNLTLALWNIPYNQLARSSVRDLYRTSSNSTRVTRTPYQITSLSVLDAPDIGDDYYANILCRNAATIFVALGDKIYSYNTAKKRIGSLIREIDENANPDANRVTALGCNAHWLLSSANNSLQIFDAGTDKLATTIRNTGQFNTIVSEGNRGFYLGSRANSFIAHYDIRSPRITRVGEFQGIISISFNNLDKFTLAASLNSTSTVNLYDVRNSMRMTYALTHKTCSKGLAFSPLITNQLITAGGSGDHSLNLWNTDSGKLIAKGQNDAQLTNVHWLDADSVFVTEGYLSNRVSSWVIKDEYIVKESSCLEKASHIERVVVSAQNPEDRSDIVTASPDESLRFWSVKKLAKKSDPKEKDSRYHRSALNALTIR
ncbi:MAG: hypothetical protein EPN84_04195 [Legionella sp.]|nr:MAG: hypothetical protein EPN84_04195 [Legionella sp.]